ncbi:hypothetical protein pdam_00017885 [Pocillopora damicornis]|uniref:Uncharacterized protein n=1 Tax=Pocillopora damicornis TaxID=46731 RepID=A0A3M6UBS2_POCDA|nr:hypothetical protein pdam_00017885 [Pocillopora damicornis]
MNADGLNIYIGHLDEIHYVFTVESRTLRFTNNSKFAQNADENSPVDSRKKLHKGIQIEADEKFRKSENGNLPQSSCINSKTTRDKKNQAARKIKLDPEHVRKIEECSFRK